MFLTLNSKLIDYFKIVILGQLHLLSFKVRLITFSQMISYCSLFQQHPFIFPKRGAKVPIKDALLIFTDGSSNGKAAYVVNDKKTHGTDKTSFSSNS